MASVNRVVLVGRLTRDPELRKTSSDLSVVSFTLAVDGRPTKDGKQPTSFINCQVWGSAAENVSRYTHKGSMVAVDGRLQQRTYMSKDNRKVSVVEVVCDNVQFLESKKDGGGYRSDNEEEPGSMNEPSKADAPVEGIDTSDDDLPF